MRTHRENSRKFAGGNLGIRFQMMQPLPSQVLRAFKAARRRASVAHTLAAIKVASRALDIYEVAVREWSGSLDAMLLARGMDSIDWSDQAQCDSFSARIDRRALQKQQSRRIAIAAARLELERLLDELLGRVEP